MLARLQGESPDDTCVLAIHRGSLSGRNFVARIPFSEMVREPPADFTIAIGRIFALKLDRAVVMRERSEFLSAPLVGLSFIATPREICNGRLG
jgi:hypothetical protein